MSLYYVTSLSAQTRCMYFHSNV